MRGRMICLEGGEGAGKSSALETIERYLRKQGREVVVTREPGGTPVAERVRAILLDPGSGEIDPVAELLLMFAARREHFVGVIEPALAAGRDVVCDRFTEASHAYQGGGRGLGSDPVDRLAGLVHPGFEPDLVLLLDVPVETGLARIAGRNADRFERDRGEFLERVRRTYLERARQSPERFEVIDATRPRKAVQAAIVEALERRLR